MVLSLPPRRHPTSLKPGKKLVHILIMSTLMICIPFLSCLYCFHCQNFSNQNTHSGIVDDQTPPAKKPKKTQKKTTDGIRNSNSDSSNVEGQDSGVVGDKGGKPKSSVFDSGNDSEWETDEGDEEDEGDSKVDCVCVCGWVGGCVCRNRE